MPRSEAPSRGRDVEAALDRLVGAVDRLTVEYGATKQRAEQAESEYGQLREVVGGSGSNGSGDLEERLKRVAAENKRLRETLAQAKERAERLRARLAVVEDEV
ncbi:MAG: hypothetical protein MJB57_08095 [Gemmatimonadetes bacterium]|nr:hypothetical protein [Gemmatimonadota bacterium]